MQGKEMKKKPVNKTIHLGGFDGIFVVDREKKKKKSDQFLLKRTKSNTRKLSIVSWELKPYPIMYNSMQA